MEANINIKEEQIKLRNLYYGVLFQQIVGTKLAYNEKLIDSEVAQSMKENILELYRGIKDYVYENDLLDNISKIEKYEYIEQVIWEWENNLN